MATWSTRPAIRGTETTWGPGSPLESPSSSLASPSSPLAAAAAPSSPPSTPPMSPSWVAKPYHPPAHMTGGDSDDDFDDDLDDSGYDDWLDSQLASTGEMTVVERLRYLLDTGQFADVNIRVGQGQNVTVFKAHRLLLSTASQPLYRLVYQVCPNPGPNEVTTIRVTDMNPKDFEHILKYIYTDHIDCKKISVAFELLRASRKWGLAGLGIKSLTYLEEFVDNFEPKTDDVNTNLFELLVLSEETLTEMSEKCWQILLKHATEVIPCEGYLNLSQVMAKKVICHKDIKFENQLKLFEAIRDWGLRYIQNHKLKLIHLGNVVEELIKVIDFDRISDADFINTVLTSECLGKAEVIAFFMTHGLEIPRNLDFNNNKQLPFWLWFCATSDTEGKPLTRGPPSPSSCSSTSNKSSNKLSRLATVNETLSKICSLTQNGSVLEFNKVCRFRKGYRCPQKEIYQEQELRFRVDKNIKLLGVGFGFLFSCTDMGINVHCQGPWETRQWTDITQSYCRVSGEKQETADVRLMFLHPVRIEANQSYKVMVKTVRMSQGSSEVELWGGTAGLYCVETEDAEFHFIKAAVDPDASVEESDGDTKPGIITELLYQLDTGEDITPTTGAPRRRRPPSEEVEESSSPRRRRPEPPEEQKPVQSSPMKRRTRAEASLKVPEIPYVRKRSPPADDQKTPEAPPLCRRRESTETSSRKTSAEEYKPESFSTNRWRTRTRETEPEYKKPPVEEYKPSSFSTNRWISRPKEDKTTSDTSSYTSQKKTTTEEYKPESFTTNRWRTRSREEGTDTKKTLDVSRKTSTEETKPVTDRWRSNTQEEKKDTPFGVRRYSKSDESTVTHPFMRRRESKDTNAEIPFYLRPRPSQSEETKTTTGSAYSRSRWGSSATNSITAKEDKPSTDTTSRSRFLRSSDSITSPSLRSTGSSTLLSRYGSARDTPLSRTRDTSLSRYGGSSGSSYLSSRYEPATSAGGTDTNSSDSSVSKYTTTPSTGAQSTSSSSYSRRYSTSSAPPGGYSSRYGSSATTSTTSGSGLSGVTSSSRYTTPAAAKEPVRYTSSVPIREPVMYGTSTSGSGSKLAALSAKYGSSAGSTSTSSGISRYGTSTSGSGSNLAALSAKYSPSAGSANTSSGVSSRYGTSGSSDTSNGSSARYGSLSSSTSGPSRYGSATSTSGSGSVLGSTKYDSSPATGRYGSPAPTSSRYGSPAPTSGSSSSYSSKYGLSAPGGGSSTLGGSSRYGSPGPTTSRYSSPAPATSRYSSPAPATSRYSSPAPTTSRYSSPAPTTRYGSSGPGSDSGAKYGSGSSLRTSTGGKDCDLCPTSRTNRYGSSTTSTRVTSPVTAGQYSSSSSESSRNKWASDGGRGKGDGESDEGDCGSS